MLDAGGVGRCIVSGELGSGKSVVMSQAFLAVKDWCPDANVVYRHVGLTPQSQTLTGLLTTVLQQCCHIFGEHPSVAAQVS